MTYNFFGGGTYLYILSSTSVFGTHFKGDKLSESLCIWKFLCFIITSE